MIASWVQPSWQSKLAQSAGESEQPSRWRDLVGLWVPNLGFSGTRVPDLSGRGNHATYVLPLLAWTRRGQAATTASGTVRYLDAGNRTDLNFGTGDFTLICDIIWGRTQRYETLFNKGAYNGAGCFAMFSDNNILYFYSATGNAANATAATANTAFQTILMRRLKDVYSLWVNGKAVTFSGTLDGDNVNYSTASPFRFGADVTAASPANTSTTRLLAYRRALLRDEIMQDYADPLGLLRPWRKTYISVPAAAGGAKPSMHYYRHLLRTG